MFSFWSPFSRERVNWGRAVIPNGKSTKLTAVFTQQDGAMPPSSGCRCEWKPFSNIVFEWRVDCNLTMLSNVSCLLEKNKPQDLFSSTLQFIRRGPNAVESCKKKKINIDLSFTVSVLCGTVFFISSRTTLSTLAVSAELRAWLRCSWNCCWRLWLSARTRSSLRSEVTTC